MSIRKRLAVSNVIMIVVPVLMALLVGAISFGCVYFTLYYTNGFGFESGEDFYRMSKSISAAADEALEGGDEEIRNKLAAVCNTLNADTTAMTVFKDGSRFYSYGTQKAEDAALVSSVKLLEGDGFVSSESRQVYRHVAVQDASVYEVYLFSAPTQIDYNTLKAAVILSAVLIVLGVACSVILTNRFLIRFVFKHIETPLDALSAGVREIGSGNLDYRIRYNRNDEFKPICDAFNEMAVRLKKSVEMTRKNEESRKTLLLNISHDLRSPLTSIQAYVEGLSDGVASSEAMRRRYLDTIKRKTAEIDRMVSQLFAFSKLDAQTAAPETEKVNLLQETEDIVCAVAQEYAQKGLRVSVKGKSAFVMLNTDLYCRIVTNLLDNSVKYKDCAQAAMEITVDAVGGDASVRFADNGPGVDAQELTEIFDVFYRTDTARNRPGDGSGIGLAFVKAAVENMHGSVRAYNDNGLTVEMTLPAVNENA